MGVPPPPRRHPHRVNAKILVVVAVVASAHVLAFAAATCPKSWYRIVNGDCRSPYDYMWATNEHTSTDNDPSTVQLEPKFPGHPISIYSKAAWMVRLGDSIHSNVLTLTVPDLGPNIKVNVFEDELMDESMDHGEHGLPLNGQRFEAKGKGKWFVFINNWNGGPRQLSPTGFVAILSCEGGKQFDDTLSPLRECVMPCPDGQHFVSNACVSPTFVGGPIASYTERSAPGDHFFSGKSKIEAMESLASGKAKTLDLSAFRAPKLFLSGTSNAYYGEIGGLVRVLVYEAVDGAADHFHGELKFDFNSVPFTQQGTGLWKIVVVNWATATGNMDPTAVFGHLGCAEDEIFDMRADPAVCVKPAPPAGKCGYYLNGFNPFQRWNIFASGDIQLNGTGTDIAGRVAAMGAVAVVGGPRVHTAPENSEPFIGGNVPRFSVTAGTKLEIDGVVGGSVEAVRDVRVYTGGVVEGDVHSITDWVEIQEFGTNRVDGNIVSKKPSFGKPPQGTSTTSDSLTLSADIYTATWYFESRSELWANAGDSNVNFDESALPKEVRVRVHRKVNIITLTAEQLAHAKKISLHGNPYGTLIINIADNNVVVPNNLEVVYVDGTGTPTKPTFGRVLLNCHTATTVTLGDATAEEKQDRTFARRQKERRSSSHIQRRKARAQSSARLTRRANVTSVEDADTAAPRIVTTNQLIERMMRSQAEPRALFSDFLYRRGSRGAYVMEDDAEPMHLSILAPKADISIDFSSLKGNLIGNDLRIVDSRQTIQPFGTSARHLAPPVPRPPRGPVVAGHQPAFACLWQYL